MTLVAVVAAAAAATACSGEGVPADVTRPETPLVTLPEGTLPDVSAPAPTEAPAPEPTAVPEPPGEPAPEPTAAPAPEGPAPTDPVEGDGATTEETIAVVLLILLVLAVVIGLVAWLARRSGARRHDEELRPRLRSISSRARWVLDQGVPAMLGAVDPAALSSTWTTVNTALVEIQQESNGLVSSVEGDGGRALADLGAAVASLRGALDTGYQMRLQHADDHELVAATDRAILTQADHLRRAVDALELATS